MDEADPKLILIYHEEWCKLGEELSAINKPFVSLQDRGETTV
jgi:hypothetical protein